MFLFFLNIALGNSLIGSIWCIFFVYIFYLVNFLAIKGLMHASLGKRV